MLAPTAAAVAKGPPVDLRFLGQAIVLTGTAFEGTTVGGLSARLPRLTARPASVVRGQWRARAATRCTRSVVACGLPAARHATSPASRWPHSPFARAPVVGSRHG